MVRSLRDRNAVSVGCHAPVWIQRRIQAQPQIPTEPRLAPHLAFYAGIAVAVVIGAFTHLIWDAFTHEGRWGAAWITSLDSDFSIAGYAVPGYKLLQYGSTLVGLPFLAGLALLSLHRTTPHHVETTTISTKVRLLVTSTVFLIPSAVGLYAVATQSTYYQALGMTIKLSGAIMAVVCIAYCGLFQALTNGDMMQN